MIDLVVSALPAGALFDQAELKDIKREAFLAILNEEEGRLMAEPALVPSVRAEVVGD